MALMVPPVTGHKPGHGVVTLEDPESVRTMEFPESLESQDNPKCVDSID